MQGNILDSGSPDATHASTNVISSYIGESHDAKVSPNNWSLSVEPSVIKLDEPDGKLSKGDGDAPMNSSNQLESVPTAHPDPRATTNSKPTFRNIDSSSMYDESVSREKLHEMFENMQGIHSSFSNLKNINHGKRSKNALDRLRGKSDALYHEHFLRTVVNDLSMKNQAEQSQIEADQIEQSKALGLDPTLVHIKRVDEIVRLDKTTELLSKPPSPEEMIAQLRSKETKEVNIDGVYSDLLKPAIDGTSLAPNKASVNKMNAASNAIDLFFQGDTSDLSMEDIALLKRIMHEFPASLRSTSLRWPDGYPSSKVAEHKAYQKDLLAATDPSKEWWRVYSMKECESHDLREQQPYPPWPWELPNPIGRVQNVTDPRNSLSSGALELTTPSPFHKSEDIQHADQGTHQLAERHRNPLPLFPGDPGYHALTSFGHVMNRLEPLAPAVRTQGREWAYGPSDNAERESKALDEETSSSYLFSMHRRKNEAEEGNLELDPLDIPLPTVRDALRTALYGMPELHLVQGRWNTSTSKDIESKEIEVDQENHVPVVDKVETDTLISSISKPLFQSREYPYPIPKNHPIYNPSSLEATPSHLEKGVLTDAQVSDVWLAAVSSPLPLFARVKGSLERNRKLWDMEVWRSTIHGKNPKDSQHVDTPKTESHSGNVQHADYPDVLPEGLRTNFDGTLDTAAKLLGILDPWKASVETHLTSLKRSNAGDMQKIPSNMDDDVDLQALYQEAINKASNTTIVGADRRLDHDKFDLDTSADLLAFPPLEINPLSQNPWSLDVSQQDKRPQDVSEGSDQDRNKKTISDKSDPISHPLPSLALPSHSIADRAHAIYHILKTRLEIADSLDELGYRPNMYGTTVPASSESTAPAKPIPFAAYGPSTILRNLVSPLTNMPLDSVSIKRRVATRRIQKWWLGLVRVHEARAKLKQLRNDKAERTTRRQRMIVSAMSQLHGLWNEETPTLEGGIARVHQHYEENLANAFLMNNSMRPNPTAIRKENALKNAPSITFGSPSTAHDSGKEESRPSTVDARLRERVSTVEMPQMAEIPLSYSHMIPFLPTSVQDTAPIMESVSRQKELWSNSTLVNAGIQSVHTFPFPQNTHVPNATPFPNSQLNTSLVYAYPFAINHPIPMIPPLPPGYVHAQLHPQAHIPHGVVGPNYLVYPQKPPVADLNSSIALPPALIQSNNLPSSFNPVPATPTVQMDQSNIGSTHVSPMTAQLVELQKLWAAQSLQGQPQLGINGISRTPVHLEQTVDGLPSQNPLVQLPVSLQSRLPFQSSQSATLEGIHDRSMHFDHGNSTGNVGADSIGLVIPAGIVDTSKSFQPLDVPEMRSITKNNPISPNKYADSSLLDINPVRSLSPDFDTIKKGESEPTRKSVEVSTSANIAKSVLQTLQSALDLDSIPMGTHSKTRTHVPNTYAPTIAKFESSNILRPFQTGKDGLMIDTVPGGESIVMSRSGTSTPQQTLTRPHALPPPLYTPHPGRQDTDCRLGETTQPNFASSIRATVPSLTHSSIYTGNSQDGDDDAARTNHPILSQTARSRSREHAKWLEIEPQTREIMGKDYIPKEKDRRSPLYGAFHQKPLKIPARFEKSPYLATMTAKGDDQRHRRKSRSYSNQSTSQPFPEMLKVSTRESH